MPKSLKLLLGAATTMPMFLFGYLFVRFVSVFLGVVRSNGNVSSERLADTFQELVGIQLATVGATILLLGVYLWHLLVQRARRQESLHVVIWVILLFVVPFVAMPVYWFTNVWPEGDAAAQALS